VIESLLIPELTMIYSSIEITEALISLIIREQSFERFSESKSADQTGTSSHSTTAATFGMPIAIPVATLDRLLEICEVEINEDLEQQESLFNEFELKRNALVQAMGIVRGRNSKSPKTLEEAKVVGLPTKTSETILQSLCFDDLKIFRNFTLENTSGEVFGGGDAGAYRKLNFASAPGTSSLPDLTMRCSFPSDDTSKIYQNTTQLVPHRLFPWSVMAYIELKRWDVNLEEHCPRCLYYCHQTLSCSPNRNFFITALYNFRSLIFCMALNTNGTFHYYATNCVFDTQASRNLARFMSFSPETLGFGNEFPSTDCVPFAPLGRGSTSVCLEVTYDGSRYVAKISRDRKALEIERLILGYLKNCRASLAVPTVVSPQENPALYDQFASPTSSNDLPFVSFLADVYELRYPSNIRLKNSVLQVWSILRNVHSLGICHRDVRFPNLCFKNIGGELKVFLIDWSSAKPFIPISELSSIASDSYPRGSSCTASNKVLRQMKDNRNDYNCFPSDEAISLIYLAHGLQSKIRLSEVGVAIGEAYWREQKLQMKTEVRDSIDALELIDTRDATEAFRGFGEDGFVADRVKAYLDIIESHMRAAIDGIFVEDNEPNEAKTDERK
jgi:hypothetical protein